MTVGSSFVFLHCMAFLDLVRRSIVLLDGAMGTMCQQLGLPASKPPEWYSMSHPDVVKRIHSMYARAGARILTTNTLGGNPIRLSHWGADDRMEEINSTGVRLAREAAGTRRYVAGSVGATGKLVRPLGDLDFEEAYGSFAQQIRILHKAGVNLLLIETMSDLQEARAAVLAAQAICQLPVLVTFTFEPYEHTMSGDSPEAIAVVMEALGVEGVGVNCVDDMDLVISVVRRMASVTHLPLLVQPNAGRPRLVGETTTFEATPDELASRMGELIDAGAGLIGGCCGTTPDHIRALRKKIAGKPPGRRTRSRVTRLASRSRVIEVAHHPCVIGELINPSGRKELREDLKHFQVSVAKKLALMQTQAGADILDVNVSVPGVEEPETMTRVVEALSSSVPTPLAIDSANPEALEAGLRGLPGKALLNSTTAEAKRLQILLPIARKYGAVVAGLTMDEDGIPERAAGCLAIAGRIVKSATEYGIEKENIVIDPLVLTAGAKPERVEETLHAVTSIRRRLKIPVMLGVSNVSHGLPDRSSINAAFLSMAVRAGADLVIVNPLDLRVSESLRAAAFLVRRPRPDELPAEKLVEIPHSPDEQLRVAILAGDKNLCRSAALTLLESQRPRKIIDRLILPTLELIGEQYGRREIYLPQLLLASEAAKAAIEPIRQKMKKEERHVEHKGRLLFATVRGDLHDIGKNIVIAVLENYGYEVIDLGRDVSNERIIECATQEKVDVICLSSLMTTTMEEMRRLTQELSRRGLDFKVLVGGAVVTDDYAESIGASYARDAQEALKKVERMVTLS